MNGKTTHRPADLFNAVRLFAALIVLWGHCYPLTGTRYDPLHDATGFSAGQIAVDVFFVLSGCLIAGSIQRQTSLRRYAAHRALRIYPALWLMLALTSAAYLATANTSFLQRWSELSAYILRNAPLASTRIDYNLAGWFEHNPYPQTVNGSLWTLPWEVRMYVLLALVGFVLRERWRLPASATLAAVGLAVHTASQIAPQWTGTPPWGDAWRFAGFYFAGACVGLTGLRVDARPVWVGSSIVLLVAVHLVAPTTWAIAPYCIALPLVALWTAQQKIHGGRMRMFGWRSDLSYGIYLYAFPVQQGLMATGLITTAPHLFIVALPVVLGLAWLSWTCVEAPCLRLKTLVAK